MTDQLADAYDSLYREFLAAFHKDPGAYIDTPGWGQAKRVSTVAEVMLDELGSRAGAVKWIQLLNILRAASKGHDVQQRSIDLIDAIARCHADIHRDVRLEDMA